MRRLSARRTDGALERKSAQNAFCGHTTLYSGGWKLRSVDNRSGARVRACATHFANPFNGECFWRRALKVTDLGRAGKFMKVGGNCEQEWSQLMVWRGQLQRGILSWNILSVKRKWNWCLAFVHISHVTINAKKKQPIGTIKPQCNFFKRGLFLSFLFGLANYYFPARNKYMLYKLDGFVSNWLELDKLKNTAQIFRLCGFNINSK